MNSERSDPLAPPDRPERTSLKCPDHPWYKGVKEPRVGVSGKKPCICEQIYFAKHPRVAVPARAHQEENEKVNDHDPETCGCGADADWCPYNPDANEWARTPMLPCRGCAQGLPVLMLDRDGVRTDISKLPGVPSHAVEEFWWPCPHWQRVEQGEQHENNEDLARSGTREIRDPQPAAVADAGHQGDCAGTKES